MTADVENAMPDHHRMLAFVPLRGVGKSVDALRSHHAERAAQHLAASVSLGYRMVGERAGTA